MNTKLKLYSTIVALLVCSMPAHATDKNRCISKQLQAHQIAEQQLLRGFATGNREDAYNAAVDIVTSETYLQVCGFSGNDPRIHGALGNRSGTPDSYAAAVFHKRLFELTHFQPEPEKAFLDVNWNRIEGGAP